MLVVRPEGNRNRQFTPWWSLAFKLYLHFGLGNLRINSYYFEWFDGVPKSMLGLQKKLPQGPLLPAHRADPLAPSCCCLWHGPCWHPFRWAGGPGPPAVIPLGHLFQQNELGYPETPRPNPDEQDKSHWNKTATSLLIMINLCNQDIFFGFPSIQINSFALSPSCDRSAAGIYKSIWFRGSTWHTYVWSKNCIYTGFDRSTIPWTISKWILSGLDSTLQE